MLFEYETDRLVLRVLKPDAAPYVLDFYNRDRTYFESYEPDRPPQFYTLGFQKQALRFEYNAAINLSSVRFYVFLKEWPNTIIGTICFHDIERSIYSSCEIGYKFSTVFQHNGYATEALQKVLSIIFEDLHLHRVMAWALVGNTPSTNLLLRLGFEFEGICREYMQLNGVWSDYAQYSLLASDFKSRNYISSRLNQ